MFGTRSLGVAVQVRVGDLGQHALDEPVADRLDAPHLAVHLGAQDVGRRGHADDAREVFGAGAQAPLLAAAHEHRRDLGAVAHVQGAETAWSVEVVDWTG